MPAPSSAHGSRLVPFERADAATVLGWARTPKEREAWAAITDPNTDPSVFDRWHAEPGVHPFALLAGGRRSGYGEVWEDPDEGEAELARLIVDPELRGRGLGRTMVAMLAERARALGYEDVWVRVVPTNAAAIACYAAAGFVRTSDEDERAFNAGQPRPYVWMRLGERRLER